MTNLRTWLITGASRGIGLEYVRQLSRSQDNIVFATCRSPETARSLQEIVEEAKSASGPGKDGNTLGTVHIIKMDITQEESVRTAAGEVKALLGEERGLDCVVNNAFVNSEKYMVSDTPLLVTPASFTQIMTTNVLGALLVLQNFTPMLERSPNPVVVNISSTAGSMGSRSAFPVPNAASYSMSKAALNMLTCKFALEKPSIITISICPGWVKTDSGGPNALITPEESVLGMLDVIRGLTQADSGTFRRYNKEVVPW